MEKRVVSGEKAITIYDSHSQNKHFISQRRLEIDKVLMKLKPSLFQLIVVLMTSSLIVSCIPQRKETQVDCNDPVFKQSKDCNSSSGSTRIRGIYQDSGNSKNSNIPSSSDASSEGDAAPSNSRSGGASGVIIPGSSLGGSRSNSGNSNGEASSHTSSHQKSGRASSSSSKSGRGGFGSFGRGSSGS